MLIVHGAIISIIWELNLSLTRQDRNATTIDGLIPSSHWLEASHVTGRRALVGWYHWWITLPSSHFYFQFEWSSGTSKFWLGVLYNRTGNQHYFGASVTSWYWNVSGEPGERSLMDVSSVGWCRLAAYQGLKYKVPPCYQGNSSGLTSYLYCN